MTTDEGRYSRVSRRMWGDEKFRALSAAKPNAQTLFQRLLTGPELGPVPGLFSAREAGLADALGWSLAAFRKCWREIEAQGMALADWTAGVVWLPNAVVHNPPASPNVVKSWRGALLEVPECDLKRQAVEALADDLAAMGPAWADAFTDAALKHAERLSRRPSQSPTPNPSRKPSAKGMANQDQDQDQDQDLKGGGGSDLDPDPRASACAKKLPPPPKIPTFSEPAGPTEQDARAVALEWGRAARGAGHAVVHGFEQWRRDFELVAMALHEAAGGDVEHFAIARVALCAWFWTAADGPIGRKAFGNRAPSPAHLAKHVTNDLAAAHAWWESLAPQRRAELRGERTADALRAAP